MVKPIRILFTIPNFHTAGSSKVVYDLVKGLDSSKFQVEIACRHDRGLFFEEVKKLGFPIHLFDTTTPYQPYLTFFSRIRTIAKFYKTHEYDMVHSWQWNSDWTEALAARLVGVKWLYTKKAMGFDTIHWKIKSLLAHFIVTINDEMRQYFPNKKAQQLIPLGIDTHYYDTTNFLNVKDSNDERFHIITVANLVPVKGLEVLLKALKILNDKAIHLTILGNKDNQYGKDMELLTNELKLETQVTFKGKVADVRPYVAASDLYIIPTLDEGRKEGMPMALVEAMSMGIPLLGSNTTGINFVLKNFKELLFPAGNSEVLADKIKDMMLKEKSQRIEIGQALRAYCIQNFKMSDFIKAHEDLYQRIKKV
uniref:glycosyltransferase n=1 Tax=Gelidibacter sp. TaxID=2018083 RepID=UPI00404AAB15